MSILSSTSATMYKQWTSQQHRRRFCSSVNMHHCVILPVYLIGVSIMSDASVLPSLHSTRSERLPPRRFTRCKNNRQLRLLKSRFSAFNLTYLTFRDTSVTFRFDRSFNRQTLGNVAFDRNLQSETRRVSAFQPLAFTTSNTPTFDNDTLAR